MSKRLAAATALLSRNPSLDELCLAYPAEWAAVEREIDGLLAQQDPDAVTRYLQELATRTQTTAGRRRSERELISAEVRRRMAAAAFSRAYTAAAAGVTGGRIRFGLVNGYLAQRLLFERDLIRKPVSLHRFRLTWPLLRQRRLLMPLVLKKGIYCFYTKQLIERLADLIGDRPCLEIAAGDGTLSRFLADRGVRITATDDHSWTEFVTYPETVLPEDAATALRNHDPAVVICSWPPPGNPFERHVFTTPTVQTYVVIGTGERASAGNWDAYHDQTGFEFSHDEALSRLVLPPEIDPAVYVFHRR